MINGLHHTGIVAQNLEPMLAFYRDKLGFSEVARLTWEAVPPAIDQIVGLDGTAATIVMLETPPEVDVPGFRVKTTCGRDPDGNSFKFQEILDEGSPMALPAG